MMKKDILSMLPTELESELAGLGEPKYRAGQIFKWLSEGVRDFDKMSNLPKALSCTSRRCSASRSQSLTGQ